MPRRLSLIQQDILEELCIRMKTQVKLNILKNQGRYVAVFERGDKKIWN